MDEWNRNFELLQQAQLKSAALVDSGAIDTALLDLIDFPVFVLDLDSTVLWLSDIAQEYLIRAWKRPVDVGELLQPYILPPVDESFQDYLDQAAAGESVELTQEAVYPDGERVFFTLRFKPLMVEGEVGAIVFTAADKSAEALALQEAATFERALARMRGGVTISSATGHDFPLTYVNDGFCQMTGYSREEVLGLNCRFLQEDLDQRGELERLREILRNHESGSVVLRNRRKDGQLFYNRLDVSPVFGASGELVEYLGLQTDVTKETELRRSMERAQRMESLGELAAGMAHDFNNVLQIILQSAQVSLSELPDSNKARSDLQTIEQAARHGRELVNDLMTFARAKTTTCEDIDLVALVESLAPMMRALLCGTGRLSVELPGVPLIIYGNRNELQQVLLNLIANARDAIEHDGSVRVVVEAVEESERGVIRVIDDGVGMTEDEVERAFEPFYSTKGDRGTGLGLATVFGIVGSLGGTVDIESEVGSGTEFAISLPARPCRH